MGEAQSLQQLMKSSQNIQYHVSKNTNLGQYYLLGVYPVELTLKRCKMEFAWVCMKSLIKNIFYPTKMKTT